MTTRTSCRAAVLVLGSVCFALSAAAQTQERRPLYDRYTEPIQIFKTGLGTFTRPMSSRNKEGR